MQQSDPARVQPLRATALNDMLWKYFEKVRFGRDKRQAAISQDAWLDESYVSRLISCQR